MKKLVVSILIWTFIIIGVVSFYNKYVIIPKEDYKIATQGISQEFGNYFDKTYRAMSYEVDELSYADIIVDYNKPLTVYTDFIRNNTFDKMVTGDVSQYSLGELFNGVGVVKKRIWLVRLDYSMNWDSNKHGSLPTGKEVLCDLGYKSAKPEDLLALMEQFPIFAEKYCLIVLNTDKYLKGYDSDATYEISFNGRIQIYKDGSKRTFITTNSCSRNMQPHRYLALTN